jgi:hypothetical protein
MTKPEWRISNGQRSVHMTARQIAFQLFWRLDTGVCDLRAPEPFNSWLPVKHRIPALSAPHDAAGCLVPITHRERLAGFGAENFQQRPHGAAGEDEADEKEHRAENFVPAQMHEVENNEHELHGGEDGERAEEQPVGERQVNHDDLHAGDDRKDHRELDEDMEFAFAGRVAAGGVNGRGGSAHGQMYSRR